MELCPDAKILAQHLCHIELERLSFIGPEEFVEAFARENSHSKASAKGPKKTQNLESYVQWFNRLSYFVGSEICKVFDFCSAFLYFSISSVTQFLISSNQLFLAHKKEGSCQSD